MSILMLFAVGVGLAFAAVAGLRVFPTVTEYWAIQRTVNKVAQDGGTTVPAIRAAFDRQREIDSISSVSGKDLEISKVDQKVVIRFAYDKEVPLAGPAFLLIKYQGQSK